MQTLQIESVCICTTQLLFRNPLFSDMTSVGSGSCHFEGLWLRQNVGSHIPSCAVSCHWRMDSSTTQL